MFVPEASHEPATGENMFLFSLHISLEIATHISKWEANEKQLYL